MCGNYSREETIQGRKLYEEIWYIFYSLFALTTKIHTIYIPNRNIWFSMNMFYSWNTINNFLAVICFEYENQMMQIKTIISIFDHFRNIDFCVKTLATLKFIMLILTRHQNRQGFWFITLDFKNIYFCIMCSRNIIYYPFTLIQS